MDTNTMMEQQLADTDSQLWLRTLLLMYEAKLDGGALIRPIVCNGSNSLDASTSSISGRSSLTEISSLGVHIGCSMAN